MKKRLPKSLVDRLDSLIVTTAGELKYTRPEDYKRGLRNDEIVTNAQERAYLLFTRHMKEAVAAWLSDRVPQVLGRRIGAAGHGADVTVIMSCLPELKLPEWVNIPADDHSPPGWKMELDATPNELQRLIDRREADIRGREVERYKYVLLRETALDKGCDLDAPIRTVFFPDSAPDGAGEPAHPPL